MKNQSKKPIDNLSDRLARFEARHQDIVNPDGKVMEETDEQKERRFAREKAAKSKSTDAFGNKNYEDVWDYMSEEEEEYWRQKRREEDPAERYQRNKEEWQIHESSFYVRGLEFYDGYGCNEDGCIPECKYYAPTGLDTFEEVEARIARYKTEEWKKKEEEEEEKLEKEATSSQT